MGNLAWKGRRRTIWWFRKFYPFLAKMIFCSSFYHRRKEPRYEPRLDNNPQTKTPLQIFSIKLLLIVSLFTNFLSLHIYSLMYVINILETFLLPRLVTFLNINTNSKCLTRNPRWISVQEAGNCHHFLKATCCFRLATETRCRQSKIIGR